MEQSNQNEMFDKISQILFSESKRANTLRDDNQEVTTKGVHPIDLEEYQEAFLDIQPEFLSDEHLELELQHYKDNLYKLKSYFPEGSFVQLATFPCNDLGSPFSDESINKRRYLYRLFINKETGLSTGYGTIGPAAHVKLLPKEIQEKCSFTVKYDSDTPWADEKDFEEFSAQFTKAYKELQRLLKP
ncbi:hypothetical protein ACFL3T_02670 [Patescibacteria group bacterium]